MSEKRRTIRYEFSGEDVSVFDEYQLQDPLDERPPAYEAECRRNGEAQTPDDDHKLLGGSMVVGGKS